MHHVASIVSLAELFEKLTEPEGFGPLNIAEKARPSEDKTKIGLSKTALHSSGSVRPDFPGQESTLT